MEHIRQLDSEQSHPAAARSASIAEGDRHRLLAQWNQTEADYPRDCCVHNLFEQQVSRTPDRVAVCFEGHQLTYSELNARANQLANYLIKLGVGPEILVGISLERSLEMLVGLLGILKAGGAYVPLDPAYPRDRLTFMLEDSQLKLLLSEKTLIAELPSHTGRTILLDADGDSIAAESTENPTTQTTAGNLAYVLYTSGSTGKPKGVQIEQSSVVNFLASMRRKPGLAADDVLVAVTTLSFDIAGLELYLPLTVGARIVIASRHVACDGEQLLAMIEQNGATVMQATPVTWRLLLDAGWQNGKLRCICGGEALPRDLARQLVKKSPSVWNLYGPTETTIWSSIYKVCDDENAIVPIGRPIANTQIYILDSILQPMPIGEVGELYIGGDGLARGYLNRPELTAEKFISNPFRAGTRLYKTGDLARYLPSGDIEFLGRIDNQVKIRGFRIELGEIEASLEEQPGIRQAVVVAKDDAGIARLVAYFVPHQGAEPVSTELRTALKERLAEYMIPAAFVRLEAMPLTANGKVDRKALPDPHLTPAAPRGEVVYASNEYERQLVAIWETLFRTEPVSIRDNFWELGGHSLLAARLMQRIEHVFGKRLLLSVLLRAPTIERLAAVLAGEEVLPVWSSLVPLQPNGPRLPFFCVHGVGGNIVGLQALARHLGPDQPFYALQAQGLDGKLPCHTRVEEMAAHYVREMRTIQPHGPYLIGGVSFGGWVALEMAIQLGNESEAVALVALLASNPGHLRPLAPSLADVFFSPTKHKLMYILPQTVKRAILTRIALRSVAKVLRDVRNSCAAAERNYHLRPYSGRITLFRPSTTLLRGSRDPEEDWREFAGGGLEVHEIAGHHVDIIAEPSVRLLATELTDCLVRAQVKHLESKTVEAR